MEEHGKINQDELQQILQDPFYSLVFSLYNSALMSLGKLPNPMTKSSDVDIDQAQVTIEMLGMLKDKTQGNLNEKEQIFLNSQLSELRFMYVEMVKQQPPPH